MVGALRAAVEKARRDRELVFAAVLPEESITAAFTAARASWNGWLYSPAVIVWVFLSQCLSADHSWRGAGGGVRRKPGPTAPPATNCRGPSVVTCFAKPVAGPNRTRRPSGCGTG